MSYGEVKRKQNQKLAPALAAAGFSVPALFGFAASWYIGVAQPNASQLAILVRVSGVLAGAVYFLVFAYLLMASALGRPLILTRRFDTYYVSLAGIALAYLAILTPLTVAAGSTAYYAAGDLFRAAVPFVSCLVLFALFPFDPSFRRWFIRFWVAIAILLAVIGGLWKAYDVFVRGHFYGGGLRQYSIPSFVLAYGSFRICSNRESSRGRLFWTALLLILTGLSVLSLKRSLWLALGLTVAMATVLCANRRRIVGLLAVMMVGGLWIGERTGMSAAVLARVAYTFAGERGVDASTFERVAEGAGAIYTLEETGTPLVYLAGRGHGAEFIAHPDFPLSKDQTGSAPGQFHHIHSTGFLLLFRYGVFGIILFLALLIPFGAVAKSLASVSFRRFALENFYGQVFAAALIHTVITVMLGIQGNIIYGDTFGAQAMTVVGSFLLVSRAYESQSGSGVQSEEGVRRW